MLVFVVDQNWKLQALFLGIRPYVIHSPFTREFRCVNTHQRKLFVGKFFLPILVPRIISNAIDSGKRVKVQRDHLSLQLFERQWLRVNPLTGTIKLGNLHFDAAEDFEVDGFS